MALMGPDGEQHSHLSKRDVADPAPRPRRAQRPVKGIWVGTRRGEDPADYAQRYLAEQAEANMTPHEEAVLKAVKQPAQDEAVAAAARRQAAEGLMTLIIEGELLPDQRRLLTQALGVLGTLP